MRNRSTVSFIGLWELLHNPEFNCLEFEAIKKESGDNGFVMTPKRWIEVTGAVGIVSKQGRYAATYAHRDIAFEFASWISPEFKLYIIEDYQRLKNDENSRLSLNWNLNREIAKLIKDVRESTGMSHKEFSEHTGIPVHTLEDLEAGRESLWQRIE